MTFGTVPAASSHKGIAMLCSIRTTKMVKVRNGSRNDRGGTLAKESGEQARHEDLLWSVNPPQVGRGKSATRGSAMAHSRSRLR